MTTLRSFAAVLALAALPGCFWVTTKDEGDAMRRDIAEIKTTQSEQGESLAERTKRLDESLDKATKLLTTNSADLGAELEKLGAEQATQAGKIEMLAREAAVLRAEIEGLKAEIAQLKAKPTAPPVAAVDKDGLFARADASQKGGQFADARRDYREFLRLYSADPRAAAAQYALGEMNFREKQFEKAIAEFQRVIDAWPASEVAPQAFFRAGEAALEMKWCVDARAYFGVLGQRFPKSALAKDAKAKLEYIKKHAKNAAICSN